jgi:hypothetical protein
LWVLWQVKSIAGILLAFHKLSFCVSQVFWETVATMSEPRLAPPGAGLPFPENLIARVLLGAKRLTGNSGAFNTHFIREREAIRGLIENRDEATLTRRVLIPRPRG